MPDGNILDQGLVKSVRPIPLGSLVEHGCLLDGARAAVVCGSSLSILDLHQGRELQRISCRMNPRAITTFADAIVFWGDDGMLYRVDGDRVEPLAGSYPLPDKISLSDRLLGSNGELLFLLTQDMLTSFDAQFHQVATRKVGSPRAGTVFGSVIPILSHSKVTAHDPHSLEPMWSTDVPSYTHHSPGIRDSRVFVASAGNNRSITALDASTGAVLWQKPLPTDPTASVGVGPSRVYVPVVGQVSVFDLRDGTPQQPIVVSKEVEVCPVIDENGHAFVASHGTVYAHDWKQQTTVDFRTSNALVLGVSGRFGIVAGGNAVHTVDFVDLMHAFRVESELLQDYDVTGGAVKPTPVFHTVLTAVTSKEAVVPNAPVEVTASEDSDLTINGTTYQAKARTPIAVKTDSHGRLRIECGAGTDGMTAPILHVRALFMPLGTEAPQLRIDPNHTVRARMTQVTADDLADARSWGDRPGSFGESLLKDDYAGDGGEAKREAAAAMITRLSGMAHDTETAPPSDDQKYVHPDCRCGCARQVTSMDAAGPTVSCSQSFQFDREAGTFRDLSHEEASQLIAGKTIDRDFTTQGAAQAGAHIESFSITGIFDDAWHAIKSGAAEVVDVVVTVGDAIGSAAEAVVKVIHEGVAQVWKVALWAVEQVHALLGAVFREIFKAILYVLEFLGLIPDWTKILETKDKMKSQILDSFDWVAAGNLSEVFDASADMIELARQDMDGIFNALTGVNDTANSTKSKAYDEGGDSIPATGAKESWLIDKFVRYAGFGSLNLIDDIPGVGGSGTAMDDPLPADLMTAIERFAVGVEQALTNDARQLMSRVAQSIESTDGSSILELPIKVVFEVLQTGADIVLDFFALMMRVGGDALQAAASFAKSLAEYEIEIPFLSELYNWLTGSKLTLLDVTALVTAFAAVITKSGFGMFGKLGMLPMSLAAAAESTDDDRRDATTGLAITSGSIRLVPFAILDSLATALSMISVAPGGVALEPKQAPIGGGMSTGLKVLFGTIVLTKFSMALPAMVAAGVNPDLDSDNDVDSSVRKLRILSIVPRAYVPVIDLICLASPARKLAGGFLFGQCFVGLTGLASAILAGLAFNKHHDTRYLVPNMIIDARLALDPILKNTPYLEEIAPLSVLALDVAGGAATIIAKEA